MVRGDPDHRTSTRAELDIFSFPDGYRVEIIERG